MDSFSSSQSRVNGSNRVGYSGGRLSYSGSFDTYSLKSHLTLNCKFIYSKSPCLIVSPISNTWTCSCTIFVLGMLLHCKGKVVNVQVPYLNWWDICDVNGHYIHILGINCFVFFNYKCWNICVCREPVNNEFDLPDSVHSFTQNSSDCKFGPSSLCSLFWSSPNSRACNWLQLLKMYV